MCGIYGLFNIFYNKCSTGHYDRYFNNGKSRGPDGSTFINAGDLLNAYLGFHRLAINGLDTNSGQPMYIKNKLLLCNGEIYNYKQLYQEYDITPKTNSDCEIIIQLYEKVGFERMLNALDGVFAFIMIDYENINDIKMFVSRDPFGVRPLFIAKSIDNTNHFGFTSIMKQFDVDRFTYEQFTPGTWEEYTLINNDDTLPRKIWKKNKTSTYFTPFSIQSSILETEDSKYQEEMYKNIIYTSLCNAVKKRVENTDRPIACLLSGGLDSSLITALVCKYYQRENRQLETYSIGMKGSEDLKYARKVASYLNTKHNEIIVTEEQFLRCIPEVIDKIESYDTTTVRASVGNYLVSIYISENSNAKVIFNGDGSDEVTGGYMYFHFAPNMYEFDFECKRLLKDICYFDVLRSDRCVASNGLEARTPFLDKSFVSAYLSIPLNFRCHNANSCCEKYLLRSAFDDKDILPSEVLWRTKEAFSDGVSEITRSWYQIIQEYIEDKNIFTNNKLELHFNMNVYSFNTPTTKEQLYYRTIFDDKFAGKNSNHCKIIPYFWMPKFVENPKDASARTLNIYKEKMK